MPDETAVTVPNKDAYLRDAETVATELEVDPATGLSHREAARRLREDGPNELVGKQKVPAWRKVLAQFQDPLIYLLLAAVAVSIIAWVAEGAADAPVDALVIIAIVLLNAFLGFTQEAKAESAVAALSTMTAATSTVLRGGELTTVPSAELVRGDILALSEGDAVGADARLITASSLRIQEASLTGESEAVTKDPAVLTVAAPLGDRANMAYRGTSVVQGVGRAAITGVGMSTEVGAIAQMLDTTTEEPTPLQNEIDRMGKLLGITVVTIALVVMITIILVQGVTTPSDLVVVLLLGVSLAVAAVPEGLPALLSVVLAIGVRRMAKLNAVVKELSAVEALGSASVICTDKTGTLTRNEMTIGRVITASGRADVTGVGYQPTGSVLSDGDELPANQRYEVQLVLGAGCLANNSQLTESDGEWHVEGDPTEAAFLVAAQKLEGTMGHVDRFVRLAEIPFTSERKMMSTVHQEKNDQSRLMLSKGAPDVLLKRCSRLQVGESTVPLTDTLRSKVLGEVESLSSAAFRTIGVAYRVQNDADGVTPAKELLEHDLVYAGVVGIIDPPRPEAAKAIAEAHRAGIRVIMITGDHPSTAARIATDLGITGNSARAVTGTELDTFNDQELRDTTREVSVYARVSPQHKLRLIDAFQADQHIVAMTGDGVNDAPALKSADIGVAMGRTGTEVTKEAARMILADDNFATIVAAVHQGRVIFDNIRKFLRYLLYSNMGDVLTVFFGIVFAGVLGLTAGPDGGLVLPLLATQILWLNLITDSGPALAMGVDPEIDDVMARKPRGWHDRAIDGGMWIGIVVTGLVISVVTLLTMDLFLPGGLIPGGTDTIEVARTAGFTTLVFAALITAFTARSASSSAFRGLFSNAWLLAAVGLSVVLQIAVVEVPFLQVAFGTASMDLAHWGTCLAFASVVLWFDEARKVVVRALAKR